VPIEYLEHTADIGLRASGTTLEQAFCEAARGLFSVMVEPVSVEPRRLYVIRRNAPSLPELLVEWLSDLLAQKELTGLFFSEFEVSIERTSSGFILVGKARGEPLDVHRHRFGTEVKGISYLGLSVRETSGSWIAQCVLDV